MSHLVLWALVLFATLVAIDASSAPRNVLQQADRETIREARALLRRAGVKATRSEGYQTALESAIRFKQSEPPKKPVDGEDITITCSLCELGLNIISLGLEEGSSVDDIASGIIELCIELDLEPDDVCSGMVNLAKNDVCYIVANSTLDTTAMCAIYVGGTCLTEEIIEEIRWTVPLPSTPKPPVVAVPAPPADAPTLRVLQVTDIHYDSEYTIGSLAACAYPCCCEYGSGNATSAADAAGMWGDYRACDIPAWTLEDALIHINQTQQIDYILWTGDNPPHDVWKQTKEEILNAITAVHDLLKQFFPNTPIYPLLGNHEANAVNTCSQPEFNNTEFSMDWLFKPLADMWTTLLPMDTYNTIRYGAYYSVLVRPGFRIVAINMNYAAPENWWNCLNYPDPAGMLAWLINELDQAEQNNEKVHLLAHIPPRNTETVTPWAENFQRIITRYESTVMAQFYGHRHQDEFTLFRDANDTTRALSIGYAGPSITTASNYNPAYRIYTVDGERENSTWAVLDHETYYIDIPTSNESPNAPTWMFEYSAKEAYGLNSLQPQDWYDFTERMAANDTLFQEYWNHYHRYSSGQDLLCDDDCKSTLLDFIMPAIPEV